MVSAIARELRVAARAPRAGVAGVLQHEEARAFPERHAAAVPGERPAGLGVEQLERVEAHEADPGHGVDPARQRQRRRSGGDQVGGQADGAAPPELQARITVSLGPAVRSGGPRVGVGQGHDVRSDVRRPGSSRPSRSRRQYQASASSIPPPMPPTTTAAGASSARESPRRGPPRRRRGREPVGPRAARGHSGKHGRDRAPRRPGRARKPVVSKRVDGPDRAPPPPAPPKAAAPAPSGLAAPSPVTATVLTSGRARCSASRSGRERPTMPKWVVTSSPSSTTTPNFSSRAMDSSMKSRESRPRAPSSPLASGVAGLSRPGALVEPKALDDDVAQLPDDRSLVHPSSRRYRAQRSAAYSLRHVAVRSHGPGACSRSVLASASRGPKARASPSRGAGRSPPGS